MATASHQVSYEPGFPSASANTVSGGLITLTGRFLFSVLFLMADPIALQASPEINAAVAAGVPFAKFLVPASGVLAFVAALSIFLLGYHAKIGGWLLVLFLVPVTLGMHNFWAVQDPMHAADTDGHVQH